MTESSSKLTWQADTQDPAKAERVRTALREVKDPELGMSVIELGLIRELDFQPEQVFASMVLTTPFCPYGPAMLEMTRRKIAEATGQPAVVEMSADMWSREMMEDGAGDDWGMF